MQRLKKYAGRGGARLSANRASDHINEYQCHQVRSAINFAREQGIIIDRHWTLNLEQLGFSVTEDRQFLSYLLGAIKRDIRRRGGEFHYIWARERSLIVGNHAHVLMGLPKGFSLRNYLNKTLRRVGKKYKSKAAKMTYAGGRLAHRWDDIKYLQGKENLENYILKYADAKTGQKLGLEMFGRSGHIIGKRVGISQSLSQSA